MRKTEGFIDILFRIPFTLYYLGFEYLDTCKRYFCVFRKVWIKNEYYGWQKSNGEASPTAK